MSHSHTLSSSDWTRRVLTDRVLWRYVGDVEGKLVLDAGTFIVILSYHTLTHINRLWQWISSSPALEKRGSQVALLSLSLSIFVSLSLLSFFSFSFSWFLPLFSSFFVLLPLWLSLSLFLVSSFLLCLSIYLSTALSRHPLSLAESWL